MLKKDGSNREFGKRVKLACLTAERLATLPSAIREVAEEAVAATLSVIQGKIPR